MSKNKGIIEIWDGKKVIGHIPLQYELVGKEIIILILEKNGQIEKIVLPIYVRLIKFSGITTIFKACCDARRKSKRQKEILVEMYGST
jgi:hypothetical protein